MKNPEINLETLVGKERIENWKSKASYATAVDAYGATTVCIIGGTFLDSLAGLNPAEVLGTRLTSIALNVLTGRAYGKWRNKFYDLTRTTEDSHWLKKYTVEFLSFNIFQDPLYGIMIAGGQLLAEGRIDFRQVIEGMRNLAVISPAFGYAMGYWMNATREICGLQTPDQLAGEQ